MTAEQEQSLIDNPIFLEKHRREVYELLASKGVGWHPFGPYVIFECPFHEIQHEDPYYILEQTLWFQANQAEVRKPKDVLSEFGIVDPSGKPVKIAVPDERPKPLVKMDLKEEKK